jgi:peptidoglycan/LPS O-acetylase OafA/YrhL
VLLGTAVSFFGFSRFFRIELTIGPTILDLGIALCIDYCLRHPAGKVGRVLNSAPMVAVGVGSYSIYLWQQMFLNRTGDWWVHSFPAALVGLAAAATLSYFLVERPCMRLREVIEHRWAGRGRSELQPRAEDVAQGEREVGGLVAGQVELAELRQNREL